MFSSGLGPKPWHCKIVNQQWTLPRICWTWCWKHQTSLDGSSSNNTPSHLWWLCPGSHLLCYQYLVCSMCSSLDLLSLEMGLCWFSCAIRKHCSLQALSLSVRWHSVTFLLALCVCLHPCCNTSLKTGWQVSFYHWWHCTHYCLSTYILSTHLYKL